MDNLESKVAVITGAASGIGLGMASESGREAGRIPRTIPCDAGPAIHDGDLNAKPSGHVEDPKPPTN